MKDEIRMTVRFGPEIAKRVKAIKKSEFYDRSYAELLRALVIAGLDAFDKKGK